MCPHMDARCFYSNHTPYSWGRVAPRISVGHIRSCLLSCPTCPLASSIWSCWCQGALAPTSTLKRPSPPWTWKNTGTLGQISSATPGTEPSCHPHRATASLNGLRCFQMSPERRVEDRPHTNVHLQKLPMIPAAHQQGGSRADGRVCLILQSRGCPSLLPFRLFSWSTVLAGSWSLGISSILQSHSRAELQAGPTSMLRRTGNPELSTGTGSQTSQ